MDIITKEKEEGAETNHIVTTTLIVEFSCGRIIIKYRNKIPSLKKCHRAATTISLKETKLIF